MRNRLFATGFKACGAFYFGIGALLPASAVAQLLTPADVVANIYHAPDVRSEALTAVTDNTPLSNDASTFDTYSDAGIGLETNDFAGLLFNNQILFSTATITLNEEFVEGDGFNATPNVYLLVDPTDPDTTDPASPGSGYQLIGTLSDYTVPDTDGASGTGTFTFDFTGLPLSSRTGYGFAIGGVPGGGSENFINVGELSATGVIAQVNNFVIKSFSFNSGTDQLSLTWTSLAAKTYRITTSPSLQDWSTVLQSGIQGQAVETSRTVGFTQGIKAFFRVEEE